MNEKTPFEQWWHNVGVGIRLREAENLEKFVKLVALNAWCSALMHAETIILRDDAEPQDEL